MEKVSEGPPQVQTYEVGTSTIHKTAAGAQAYKADRQQFHQGAKLAVSPLVSG